MGCASSKSTPVVEPNENEDLKDTMASNGESIGENVIKKGKDIMHNIKNDITDMASGVSHKVGSLIHGSNASKPNTPETERAHTLESDNANETGTNEMADENNQQELKENQLSTSLSVEEPEDCPPGGDKPLTPMPEKLRSSITSLTPSSKSHVSRNQDFYNKDSEMCHENNNNPSTKDVYDSMKSRLNYFSDLENNQNTSGRQFNRNKGTILSESEYSFSALDGSLDKNADINVSDFNFEYEDDKNYLGKSVRVPYVLNLNFC